MNVTLPNGKVIKGVPKGTSKDEIMQKAISGGLATAEDFDIGPSIEDQIDQGQTDYDPNYQAPEQAEEATIGDKLVGGAEAALTAATGATGGTLGLLGGTLQGVISELRSGEFGSNAAANRIADRAEAAMSEFTYAPRTETGKEYVETMGEVGDALAPMAGLAGPMAQAGQLAKAAVPVARTAGKDLAISAGESAGKAGQEVMALGKDLANAKMPGTREKSRELMTGDVDRDLYDVELAGEAIAEPTAFQKLVGADLPKIQKNKEAVNAANQGFDEGFLDVINKRATPEDKKAMLEMTRISEKGKKDPLFEVDNRPADVAGSILLDKVNEVKRINRDAGKAIDKEAQKLKGVEVDVESIGDSFKTALDDMDVSINPDMTLNFDKSFLKALPGPRKSIKVIFDEMAQAGNPTALDLHKLKRFIDEQVSYGKSIKGLGGNAERSLKGLRSNIKTLLDDKFPGYAKANKAYSETIGALDEVQRLAGKNTDLSSDSAQGALGVLSRRLMSNAQSRSQLNDAIKGIDKSIKSHGGFSVDGNRLPNPNKKKAPNLKLMMLYADELDKVLGTSAKTSLTGALDTSLDAAKNAQSQTMTGLAVDAAKTINRKARNINKEGAYKSMRALLKK
ncbi:MAG: hypothetical protein JKY50_22500 [Oleispira sp.]|nr:hypothetical protein [Oleispira sp.]